MKKVAVLIDPELLAAARAACGAGSDAETVSLGLEALVRRAAYERARMLLGSERCAVKDVRRRRENASRKRRRIMDA